MAYILLNQPGKLNALDEQMLEAIERCFCVWESEGQVKVTNGLKLPPRRGHVSNVRGPPTASSQGGFPADSSACGCLNTSGGVSDFYGLTDQRAWNNIVITMRAVHVSIRQIGNSQGVVIPKPVLAQLGLDATAGVEMTIEDGALVLRRPASPARTGWAEAARGIAEAGDDELVMGEFGNAGDSELVW